MAYGSATSACIEVEGVFAGLGQYGVTVNFTEFGVIIGFWQTHFLEDA
jgi:hypothetical protein